MTLSNVADQDAGGLQVTSLSCGYGSISVLRDLDLSVKLGSVAAVIGPNGHGKTTLLRAISGQIKPKLGKITLDQKQISGLPSHQVAAAGVTHVPQGDLLFPAMSVYENLLLGAYLVNDQREVERRLARVFELLPKLAERKSQIADSLSGGERRMVGIGRGLMADGRILLLDEPSLGLAPIVIDTIYDLITKLKSEGRSILIVEENPERISELADVIYLMDNGEISWSGSAAELETNEDLMATYLGA